EIAVEQPLDGEARWPAQNAQLEPRKCVMERPQHAGQQMLARRAAGADAQHAAARGLVRGQDALRFVDLVQDLARILEQNLAGWRWAHARAVAQQQLDAEQWLLGADLLADGRLAEAEAAPGAGETAQIDDGDERAQQLGIEILLAPFGVAARGRGYDDFDRARMIGRHDVGEKQDGCQVCKCSAATRRRKAKASARRQLPRMRAIFGNFLSGGGWG